MGARITPINAETKLMAAQLIETLEAPGGNREFRFGPHEARNTPKAIKAPPSTRRKAPAAITRVLNGRDCSIVLS